MCSLIVGNDARIQTYYGQIKGKCFEQPPVSPYKAVHGWCVGLLSGNQIILTGWSKICAFDGHWLKNDKYCTPSMTCLKVAELLINEVLAKTWKKNSKDHQMTY